jgi:aminoglycoside phosphotransferase family enzyme
MLENCVFPDSCQDTRFYETHISWVALTDHYAFKIKRPVKYSFLNFSTPEKREHYCQQELVLNRRLAPDMYLGLLPITASMVTDQGNKEGREVIDYAVQMKRMDNELEMDRLLKHNKVTEPALEKLAGKIAGFHQTARIIKNAFDTTGFQDKFADLHTVKDDISVLVGGEWDEKILRRVDQSNAFLNASRSYINQRIITGFRRDGHGDLNASNIFLYEQNPVIFDCIEFNEEYRYIDVLNDIAFLCVDLDFYGNEKLGDHFYRHYLEAFGTEEDDDTRRLFAYYKAYRANVRAKVSAISARKKGAGEAELRDIARYLELMDLYCEEF